MYDKTFIGRRCASVSKPPELEPISKIVLWVDSENCYEAGDNTGREFETTCPYGSQQMADDLLAKLRGYVYKPLEAEDAIIDPAAEIGDAVTVDGRYTILANAELSFDSLLTFNVSAPGASELPLEYSFSNNEKVLNRKIARTRSLISKTAEEIRFEVSGLDDKYTALSVTLDGVTVTDSTGTTKIKGSSIETDTLYVNAANISGQLTADQIDATNLKVSAANITGTLAIGSLPSGVALTSDIPTDYEITLITNDAIRTASISASQITTGSLSASALSLDGLLKLTYFDSVYGYVGVNTGKGGPVLSDSTQSVFFVTTPNAAKLSYKDSKMIWVAVDGCYSNEAMKVYSDQRLKNTISYDLTDDEKVFFSLKPCSFQMNGDESGKKHWGFIAQDVVGGVESAGQDANKLAAIGNYEGMYSLAYGEFTALNTHMIQKLMARVAELERKMEE